MKLTFLLCVGILAGCGRQRLMVECEGKTFEVQRVDCTFGTCTFKDMDGKWHEHVQFNWWREDVKR